MRQKSIFYLGTIITVLVLSQVTAGYWYWTADRTVTVTSGMFDSSDILRKKGDVSVTADDPSRVQIKATTSNIFGETAARFIYDTGKNNLGGSYTTSSTKYRAYIT